MHALDGTHDVVDAEIIYRGGNTDVIAIGIGDCGFKGYAVASADDGVGDCGGHGWDGRSRSRSRSRSGSRS